ncbi:unnamed protein product [Vitrella brassicaformis CCMP3155]|uniref:Uncharacterized protein n=1 Tax=Vitrella brassicaformis (strain CCMP3155) TaxID=1169540 RepID=A0A0G4FCD0_VITBC|nr:unnamed protein product [Vitrella brassicaformis CCMP3155]|eukprot:CEM10248.1 unnamed protein product [Vitrella brassicaformis CCMP3155]
MLGRLVSSSRSLRRVDGSLEGEDWAGVFEGIPAAPAGQQGGPLAQLDKIGTINLSNDCPAGVERLQEALVARGCRRSLKELSVCYEGFGIDRHSMPTLLALDRLVGTCCRPDAHLELVHVISYGRFGFDISIFYHDTFPTHPPPSFKTMMQQLAQEAMTVKYIFTQDNLDNLDNPSPAAIDIASSLVFRTFAAVEVGDFAFPGTPSSSPSIITHLQPFPQPTQPDVDTELSVRSDLGCAAARLFATKMPKMVDWLWIDSLSDGEKLGLLTALGRDREVGATVHMRQVDVDQLVGAANELPTIKELDFELTLPDGVEDAGSFVRTRLSSVIRHIRGLRLVELYVGTTTAEQHASIENSLPVGTNIEGFSVESIRNGGTRVTITARRNA